MNSYSRAWLTGRITSAITPSIDGVYCQFEFHDQPRAGSLGQARAIPVVASRPRAIEEIRRLPPRTLVLIEGGLRTVDGALVLDAVYVVALGEPDAPPPEAAAPPEPAAPRKPVSLHDVARHQRTLASGRVIWVRAHQRGLAATTGADRALHPR